MNMYVELSRRTWNATIKLAIVVSIAAALFAATLNAMSDVPQSAIVLGVILVAFTASWVLTGRVQREQVPLRIRSNHG